MEIIKQIKGFTQTMYGKTIIRPSYNRTFHIEINPTRKISHSKGKVCPFCGATKESITKSGHRKVQRRTSTQRYYCHWCERRFSLSGDMHSMRFNRKIIEKALSLRQSGCTLREIQNKLNNIVSHESISRWIKKWEKKKK